MTTVSGTMDHGEAQADGRGGRLVPVDERTLPLRAVALRAEAAGGVCRTLLEQRFGNPWPDPLAVVYRLPLPADGAVSGYAFRIGDRRITGEVDRKARARERFDKALLSGRTAALLDEERDDLFTQEIGNLPPGAELVAEITIDQPLLWVEDEGAWEWRFPTAAAPRYLGAPGRVPDAEKVSIDVANGPLPVRLALSLDVGDALPGERRPESPSHTLRVEGRGAERGARVTFAEPAGVPLDRDVVVRWTLATASPGIGLETALPPAPRGSADVMRKPLDDAGVGLLTIVPPAPWVKPGSLERDLIVLLDTSGSMHGAPIDQARRIALALVDSLGGADQLELIAFGSTAVRWKQGAVRADLAHKREARGWLEGLSASGGTEMGTALEAALAPLRDGTQRQLVLVSDGQIGFEEELVRMLLERLPESSRLHAVGVGSAVNRSLTRYAARAGRGVEILVGLGEDPERAALRLLAHTAAPSLVALSIEGDALMGEKRAVVPARMPDVFAGAPVRLSLRLRRQGGTLRVRGRTVEGAWEQTLRVPPIDGAGQSAGRGALPSLWAREAVADLETERIAGGNAEALDAEITRLGLLHQIATRLTSWVAIDETISVDPTAPTRRTVVPQMLPYGQSLDGVPLRAGPAVAIMQRRAGPRSEALAKFLYENRFMSVSQERPKGPKGVSAPDDRSRGIAEPDDIEELAEGTYDGLPREPRASFRGLLRRLTPTPQGGVMLIIEFEAQSLHEYRAPETVVLARGDGTVYPVELQAELSTRPGPIKGGQRVRLVLHSQRAIVPADFDFVDLTFEGGQRLRVEL